MMSVKICGFAALLLVLFSIDTSFPMASGESPAASSKAAMAGKAAGYMNPINMNTASIDALSKIPGLSPKIGEAVKAYRDANGAFKSISDLANVEEIDPEMLEKIKPFLSI